MRTCPRLSTHLSGNKYATEAFGFSSLGFGDRRRHATIHPRKLFEMPKAQTADDGLLDGRDVGIDLVSTERHAHHRPGGATALCLADELGDGLGYVVRLRSVLSLQH